MDRILTLLIVILFFTGCVTDTKTPPKTSTPDSPGITNPTPKPSASELEDMKKNDIKGYMRSKYDKIVTGFESPECIKTDGTHFYVSNVGKELAPTVKDGDGYISKLDANGNVLDMKWVTGLHAPKGMEILNGKLYVTDIDRVYGFDLKSKKKVFEVDLRSESVNFLNDLCIKNDQALFVSATNKGAVYEIDLRGTGNFKMVEIYGDLMGVNGLQYKADEDKLIMAGFGLDGSPTGMISYSFLNKAPIKQKFSGGFHGYLDGLQMVGPNIVLMTDWQSFEKGGNLMYYNLESEELASVLGGTIGGPADFYYDHKTKNVWLPAMQDNEIIITKININTVQNGNPGIDAGGGYEFRIIDTLESKQEFTN